MALVADRLNELKPSATGALTQLARELKAAGHPVISLTVGEPDFETPAHIREAGKHAIDTGNTKYTDITGSPELKDAIRDKFQRENGLNYANNQIIVSTGAKQIIFNAYMASLNPGERVVMPAPYWVSYPEIVRFAGGVPDIVPCSEANGFKLTPEQLEEAITPQTKWLNLNTPNNPTGAIYSPQELRGLADVLVQHPHVHIMTDDMYEHLRFDGRDFPTMAQVAPELYDRTLTINGVSKGYAMTGWRIGFAGGPADLIKAMGTIQGHSTTSPSAIAQAAAIEALNGPQDEVLLMREAYQRRRDMMVQEINQAPGLSVTSPEGAFYLFINCQEMLGKMTPNGSFLQNDMDVCKYLLEDHYVAVVPGEAFGMEGYFRAAFGAPDKDLAEACQRMKTAGTALRQ